MTAATPLNEKCYSVVGDCKCKAAGLTPISFDKAQKEFCFFAVYRVKDVLTAVKQLREKINTFDDGSSRKKFSIGVDYVNELIDSVFGGENKMKCKHFVCKNDSIDLFAYCRPCLIYMMAHSGRKNIHLLCEKIANGCACTGCEK